MAYHTFLQNESKWCMANLGCAAWRNVVYEQRHEITYKGGMSIWEGPIADLMLVQFLEKLKNIEKQCPSLTCFLLPEFLWWLKYDWQ